jgi:hypothetical protein
MQMVVKNFGRWLVELQGHADCPSKFDEGVFFYQLIPTTEDHTSKFGRR